MLGFWHELPGPVQIVSQVNTFLSAGGGVALMQTLADYLGGLLAGILLGTLLGFFVSLHWLIAVPLVPILKFVRTLAPIALIFFVETWADGAVMSIVTTTVGASLAVSLFNAVRELDSTFIEVGNELRMGKMALLRHVYIPSLTPRMVAALRIQASMAWMTVLSFEALVPFLRPQIEFRANLGRELVRAVADRNSIGASATAVFLVIVALGFLLDSLWRSLLARKNWQWWTEFRKVEP